MTERKREREIIYSFAAYPFRSIAKDGCRAPIRPFFSHPTEAKSAEPPRFYPGSIKNRERRTINLYANGEEEVAVSSAKCPFTRKGERRERGINRVRVLSIFLNFGEEFNKSDIDYAYSSV